MKHEVLFVAASETDLQKLLGAAALAGFSRARVKTIIVEPEAAKPSAAAQTSKVIEFGAYRAPRSSGVDKALQETLPLGDTPPDESYMPTHNTHRGPAIKPYEFANGKADKGITARDLLLEILRSENRVFSGPELAYRFKSHGFNEHSYTTAASTLLKDKAIRRVARSRYCIPGTVVHPPVQ
jgi:hypothetical protein